MANIPDELRTLIEPFEKNDRPFGLHEVSQALVTFLKDHPEHQEDLRPSFAPEIIAFNLYTADAQDTTVWGTYHGPIFSFKTDAGGRVDSPSLEEINQDVIEHWKQRSNETQNPILRARYADAVWDLSEKTIGKKPDVSYAQIAAKAYLTAVEQRRYEHIIESAHRLERALDLAISINDSQLVQSSVDAIMRFAEDTESRSGVWTPWGFAFDVLVGNKKTGLPQENEGVIIRHLERRLSEVSNTHGDGTTFDPFASKDTALQLAQYYSARNDRENAQRVVVSFGKAFEYAAAPAAPFLAMAWLEWVHDAYQQYGLTEEAERIRVIMKERGLKAQEQMPSFSTELKLSAEEMKAFLDDFVTGDLGKALVGVARWFLPVIAELRNQIQDTKKNYPLFGLFSTAIVNEGQVVARVGPADDDPEGHIFLEMGRHIAFRNTLLPLVMDRVVAHYELNADKLASALHASPLFDEDRRHFLEHGLRAYFAGDHLTAIHVLVPQIEHILRRLLASTGHPTNKSVRGVFQEKSLGVILREPVLNKILGDDVRLYLLTLLADQRGWNLRNILCHGMMNKAQFNRAVADRVLHVLLVLGSFRKRQEEAMGGKGNEQ